MFSGLIQDIGTVAGLERGSAEARIAFATGLGPLEEGESVAVDGACLTVTATRAGGFSAFASPETLGRTGLADARAGHRVNLERALRADGLLGGHLVTGHVDTRVRLLGREPAGAAERWSVALPDDRELALQVAPRGSVAVQGVSLTVGDVFADRFALTLIPLTLAATTLGAARPGDLLNLETDVLAKYVARRLERGSGGVDLDLLARSGFAR